MLKVSALVSVDVVVNNGVTLMFRFDPENVSYSDFICTLHELFGDSNITVTVVNKPLNTTDKDNRNG